MGCSATAAPKRHNTTTARLMAMTVCLLMFPKGDPLSVKPINSLEQIGRVPSLVTRLTDVHARSDFGLATGECFNADAEFDSTARAAAGGGGRRARERARPDKIARAARHCCSRLFLAPRSLTCTSHPPENIHLKIIFFMQYVLRTKDRAGGTTRQAAGRACVPSGAERLFPQQQSGIRPSGEEWMAVRVLSFSGFWSE